MSGYSSRHTFNQVTDASNAPVLTEARGRMLARLVVGGLIAWLMGIQFTAGLHFATTGSTMYATSIADGFFVMIAVELAALAALMLGIRARGIRSGIALALGTIFVVASFPFGAILGCLWNSIAGTFPDMSGIGNAIATIAGFHAFSLIVR